MKPCPVVVSLVASLAVAGAAHAQTVPAVPPPAPETPALTAPGEDAERQVIDQASDLIAHGRAAEARSLLDAAALGRPAPAPYAALPVLQRLATAMTLQAPVLEALSRTRARPRGERSGLEGFELYFMGFVYGVGTGIWVDVLANVSDVRTGLWVPILGGGMGLGAAWLVDHGHPVRRGRAAAADTGMLLGLGAGLGVALELNRQHTVYDCPIGSVYDCGYSGGLSVRGFATSMWLGATLGLGAGLGLAALTDATPASASFVLYGGLWGGALAMLTAAAVSTSDYAVPWLVGEGLGAAATLATAALLHPTEAQVRWMNLGVLAGALLGGGIAVLPYTNGTSVALPVTIIELGMVGGGIAGFLLGAPARESEPATAGAGVAASRFRVDPTLVPTRDGAMVLLSMPHLL